MSEFNEIGCGLVEIGTDLHPLTEALKDAYRNDRWGIMPPRVKQAYDNIVRAAIVVPYPMFVCSGTYQNDELIGKRLVSVIAEGEALDPTNSSDISLNSTTGTITSSVDGRHWITIGYEIEGLPDLMP